MTIVIFFYQFFWKRYELQVFWMRAEAVLALNVNCIKNILVRRVYGLIAGNP
jgi:hypothetical protein